MVTNCITLTAQKTGDHAYFAYQGTHFYQKHNNAEFFGVYKWTPCITLTAQKTGDHAYFAYQGVQLSKTLKRRIFWILKMVPNCITL